MTARLIRLLMGLCIVVAAFSACGTKRQYGSPADGSGGAAGGGGGAGPLEACSPGEGRCQGLSPERCSDEGVWVTSQASCAVACLNAECVTCKEGATTCQNGAVQKCAGGVWTTTEVCSKVCEGDSCVDACTEGLLQCNGVLALEKCVGGVYVADEACEFLCSDGACTGACAPDDTRCNPDAPSESQVCNAEGEWDVGAPCSDGTFCVSGRCTPCMPGTARCGTSGPQLCSEAGEWVNQTPCMAPNAACFDGECVSCVPGEKRCMGQNVEQCATDGGSWTVVTTCSGETPACLSNTKTCGKCAEGETQCLGDDVQTCNAQSVFQTTKTCSGLTPRCAGTGQCVTCLPNETRSCGTCNSGTQTCSNGAWGSCIGEADLKTSKQYCGTCNTSCSASQVCENGSCLIDCGTKTRCGGACVNLATDTSNCLACGTKCSPPAANGNAVCTASGCDISCSNTRCGTSCCGPTPAGATAGCSGNSCTFTCGAGKHGCGGSTPPCYDNSDADHCGSSCLDCSAYAGTTGTCSGNECACAVSSLACGASVPTCGNWDFSNGVGNWRFGDRESTHHWVGALGTTFTNGSPALSAQYDGTDGGGAIEFEVDLCPNAALLNMSNYILTYDYYFQTTGGTMFSPDPSDANSSYLSNGNSVITACQPGTDPGVDEWLKDTCANLPSQMTNLTIVFRVGTSWSGKVYIDNVKFTPK